MASTGAAAHVQSLARSCCSCLAGLMMPLWQARRRATSERFATSVPQAEHCQVCQRQSTLFRGGCAERGSLRKLPRSIVQSLLSRNAAETLSCQQAALIFAEKCLSCMQAGTRKQSLLLVPHTMRVATVLTPTSPSKRNPCIWVAAHSLYTAQT